MRDRRDAHERAPRRTAPGGGARLVSGWSRHEGRAVALPAENVDTDQLIPARFMSAPRSEGYGRFLLHDRRRDGAGALDPAFPLNAEPGASVLVARRNFGSGSSREAAVYALLDAGFRAVAAPSFGDIFAANAANNGLLPARVSPEDAERLIAAAPGPAAIDLGARSIAVGDARAAFEIDPVQAEKIARGWNDIDLTVAHGPAIAAFRDARRRSTPWFWPGDVEGPEAAPIIRETP